MTLQKNETPDTVQAPPAAPPPETDMPESFTFSLDDINSAFGISAETLRALAQSHGVSEEQIVIRALTEWAKKEIPDLDLDSPSLSQEQVKRLLEHRNTLDQERNASGNTLRDVFDNLLRGQGEADGNDANSAAPPNGRHL